MRIKLKIYISFTLEKTIVVLSPLPQTENIPKFKISKKLWSWVVVAELSFRFVENEVFCNIVKVLLHMFVTLSHPILRWHIVSLLCLRLRTLRSFFQSIVEKFALPLTHARTYSLDTYDGLSNQILFWLSSCTYDSITSLTLSGVCTHFRHPFNFLSLLHI